MIICNHCEGSGFVNLHQLDGYSDPPELDAEKIIEWLKTHEDTDIAMCPCCSDGSEWYGARGWHYSAFDPPGKLGKYSYNGGLCECH